jgi:hypothetical protein
MDFLDGARVIEDRLNQRGHSLGNIVASKTLAPSFFALARFFSPSFLFLSPRIAFLLCLIASAAVKTDYYSVSHALLASVGKNSDVITTNYDQLIERAREGPFPFFLSFSLSCADSFFSVFVRFACLYCSRWPSHYGDSSTTRHSLKRPVASQDAWMVRHFFLVLFSSAILSSFFVLCPRIVFLLWKLLIPLLLLLCPVLPVLKKLFCREISIKVRLLASKASLLAHQLPFFRAFVCRFSPWNFALSVGYLKNRNALAGIVQTKLLTKHILFLGTRLAHLRLTPVFSISSLTFRRFQLD